MGQLLFFRGNRTVFRRPDSYQFFREDERQEALFVRITERPSITIGELKSRYFFLAVDELLERLKQLKYVQHEETNKDRFRATSLGIAALRAYRSIVRSRYRSSTHTTRR